MEAMHSTNGDWELKNRALHKLNDFSYTERHYVSNFFLGRKWEKETTLKKLQELNELNIA